MADAIKKIQTTDGAKPIDYAALYGKPSSDETLSVQGAFADAKAVGDKFKEVKTETDSLREELDNYFVKPENYNRLKDKTFVYGTFNNNGDIIESEDTTKNKVFLMYIPVEEETNYIVSGNYFNYIGQARCYDINRKVIQNGLTISDGRLVTTSLGAKYVRISVGNASNAESIIFQKGSSPSKIENVTLNGVKLQEKSINEKMLDDTLFKLINSKVDKRQFTQQGYSSNLKIEYESKDNAVLVYYSGNITIRCGYGSWDFSLSKILEMVGNDYTDIDSLGRTCIKIPDCNILCLDVTNPNKRLDIIDRNSLDLDTYVPLIGCVSGAVRGIGLLHQDMILTRINKLDSNVASLLKEKDDNIPEYVRNEVENVYHNVDTVLTADTLSFAFITDSHAFTTTHNFNGLSNAYISISLLSEKMGYLGCCISGGDNTTERDEKNNKYNTMDVYRSLIDKVSILKWVCKGNHDDGSISAWSLDSHGTYTNKITDDELYVAYDKISENGKFVTDLSNKSGQYSYIDFPNNAIRIYCLNSVDVSADEAGQHLFKFGENQISWVKQTLLLMPKNYNVLFITHVCPINLNDEGFTKTEDDYIKDNSGLEMFNISKAIKNHTAINGLDMSKNTGDFISWICGHTHKDYDAIKDGILFISTMQSANQEEGKTGYGTAVAKDGNTYYNVPDTADETAYDIFTINPISKKIYATRYGVGADREWTYSN